MLLSLVKKNELNKNIALNIIIKAVNILCVILIVRKSIDVLGVVDYGIWTAIASIGTWICLLDVGIGNGLRIELRRCFIEEDWKEARVLLNTAYLFVGGFSIAVLALFFIIWLNVDWSSFFNIKNYDVKNINFLVLITVAGLVLQLIFSLITPVLNANLDAGLTSIFFAISNFFILVYLYTGNSMGILQYALISAFFPVFAYVGFSIFYFFKYLPQLIPTKGISYLIREETNFKKIRGILFMSAKFFLLQISAILMYQMMGFLIIQYFTPNEATQYNVAFRYFNLFYIGFTTIIAPIWSLTTDAYLKRDLDWIIGVIKKSSWLLILVLIGIVIGYLIRDYVFNLWVPNVEISPKICLYVALYTAILSFNTIFLYVINGTGKIHLQSILAIITAIVYIPLTHFFIKNLNMGLDGVFIANLAMLLMFTVFIPIQTYFLLKTNKQGIWNK